MSGSRKQWMRSSGPITPWRPRFPVHSEPGGAGGSTIGVPFMPTLLRSLSLVLCLSFSAVVCFSSTGDDPPSLPQPKNDPSKKKDAAKPDRKTPAVLSRTNPQEAYEWLKVQAREVWETDDSNVIARAKAREKLEKKLAALRGTKVEWPLKVLSVTDRVIFINAVGLRTTSEESMEESRPRGRSASAGRFNGSARFPHHNEPWLEKLRSGSIIKVTGTIKKIDCRSPHTFDVFLSDWKIAPPK
jgi:hypothetical protein